MGAATEADFVASTERSPIAEDLIVDDANWKKYVDALLTDLPKFQSSLH